MLQRYIIFLTFPNFPTLFYCQLATCFLKYTRTRRREFLHLAVKVAILCLLFPNHIRVFSPLNSKLLTEKFAHLQILLYLCTRNESTPWDYVFKGGQLQDIIKGVITRFVLGYSEPGKFSITQDIAAF